MVLRLGTLCLVEQALPKEIAQGGSERSRSKMRWVMTCSPSRSPPNALRFGRGRESLEDRLWIYICIYIEREREFRIWKSFMGIDPDILTRKSAQ